MIQRFAIAETSGTARPPKLEMPATFCCQDGCAYPPAHAPALIEVQLLTPPPPPRISMKGFAIVPNTVLRLAVLQNASGLAAVKYMLHSRLPHEEFHTISGTCAAVLWRLGAALVVLQ